MTSEEVEAKAREIESAIQSREGVILKQLNPVAKTLSYPIKSRASGFFGVLEFRLEEDKLVELKEMVAKDGKIVRHIVIIKEPVKVKKERRSRIKAPPTFEIEQKTEVIEPIKEEKPVPVKTTAGKEKVELKDIEQKLDELLGE